MAHHSRVRSSGNAWLNILPTEAAALDANLAASINAVGGGTWAPAAQVHLSGSGMALQGPLVVARGGQLISGNGQLAFDPGDFPLLGSTHSGRTRNVLYPFLSARPVPFGMWRVRRDSSAMQSVAPTYNPWQVPGSTFPAGLAMRIRGVQKGTIGQITISFTIPTPHTTVPTKTVGARLLRVDASGNAVACTSAASGADGNGYVYAPTPTSADAWRNGGGSQTFVLPVDQNNYVTRDQDYFQLEVIDEQGLSGFPWNINVLKPCRLLLSGASGSFPLAGTGAFDGLYPIVGNRVLVVNTHGNQETGIYVVQNGSWVRASDFAQASQFGQGFIVGIQEGQKYAGTWWQSQSTQTAWAPGTTPPCSFWLSGSGVSLNSTVLPLTASGYWYICTTAGTSGTTEPSWPKNIGQTVTDNGVVWACAGPASTPLTMCTRPDADNVGPGLAMNGYGTIFHAALVEYVDIGQVGWQ